ncbi:MAG: hypothetical protein WA728_11155, partial [Xanthobacteraceae bacterium]
QEITFWLDAFPFFVQNSVIDSTFRGGNSPSFGTGNCVRRTGNYSINWVEPSSQSNFGHQWALIAC